MMGYGALALANVVDLIVPSCLKPTPEPLRSGSITSVHDTLELCEVLGCSETRAQVVGLCN